MKHFSKLERILLVGEGDFSFSVCLAKYFGSARKMVATSLDTQAMVMSKYRMGMQNLKKLEETGCTVIHGVDATNMNKHPLLSDQQFGGIVYNFPHAGLRLEGEGDIRQIRRNQTLMTGFFRSAHDMVKKNGNVYVTHKTSHPYSEWKIEELANNASFYLFEKSPFKRSDYPGYINKKAYGPRSNRTFPVGDACLYGFVVKK